MLEQELKESIQKIRDLKEKAYFINLLKVFQGHIGVCNYSPRELDGIKDLTLGQFCSVLSKKTKDFEMSATFNTGEEYSQSTSKGVGK